MSVNEKIAKVRNAQRKNEDTRRRVGKLPVNKDSLNIFIGGCNISGLIRSADILFKIS